MRTKIFSMEEISRKLPKTETNAFVEAYIQDVYPDIQAGLEQRRPAVLILPGGGYSMTSNREADPVARRFAAEEFTVFTLRYSCAPDRYPTQLLQAAATLAHMREHADEYHIDPERIFVLGFSAGGHLCASLGILWKDPIIKEVLGIENELCRPTGMVPCYPVITSGEFANKGTFVNLLGEGASQEQLDAQSMENRVDADTVPAFIWHTYPDDSVPVENSLLFAQALRRNKIPFELHIYPTGVHGASICKELTSGGHPGKVNPHAQGWLAQCIEWMHMIK